MAKQETVAPLESVTEAPKKKGELCWNCSNQGEKNVLDSDGNCEVCGFQKSQLFNGDLEAEKASKRQASAETKFNKSVLN